MLGSTESLLRSTIHEAVLCGRLTNGRVCSKFDGFLSATFLMVPFVTSA